MNISNREPNAKANCIEEISPSDVFSWLEFASWIGVLIIPLLYYINGPCVSGDQAVMRLTLIATSVTIAVGTSARRLWHYIDASRA